MIPYSYNMVDMGGIDLAEANGTEVPGIYSEIVEAVNACGDTVLYNWKFAGIEIAPQHTSILLGEGQLLINGAVQVTEQDVVTIITLEPDPPVLVSITAESNGIYLPSQYDADGFSIVDVQVPAQSAVIEGNVPPTSDIGSDGDYYQYNVPAPIMLGITIEVAARNDNYSFTYWGAKDIQIVFEDLNGDEVSIKDIQGAECYWAAGTGPFTRQDDVISGQASRFYEHNGMPGYWKFVLPSSMGGYKVKKLQILLRSDSYLDFYRSFNFAIWSANRTVGINLITVENSVVGDWTFSGYNDFSFTPVELTGTVPYFYKKINGEWILIK